MHLLIVILHHEEILDDVLSGLVELELSDSVVMESRSGLELLERDLPIFAGLRSMIPGGLDFCRLVLCVVERPAVVDDVMRLMRRLGDDSAADGGPGNTAVLIPLTSLVHF